MAIAVADQHFLRAPELWTPRRMPNCHVVLNPNHPLVKSKTIREAFIALPGGLWDLTRNKFSTATGTIKVGISGKLYFAKTGSSGSLTGAYDPDNYDRRLLSVADLQVASTTYINTCEIYSTGTAGFGFAQRSSGTTGTVMFMDQQISNSSVLPSSATCNATFGIENKDGTSTGIVYRSGIRIGSISPRTYSGTVSIYQEVATGSDAGGVHFIVWAMGGQYNEWMARNLSLDPYQLVVPA